MDISRRSDAPASLTSQENSKYFLPLLCMKANDQPNAPVAFNLFFKSQGILQNSKRNDGHMKVF
jgi:hypothetical protein